MSRYYSYVMHPSPIGVCMVLKIRLDPASLTKIQILNWLGKSAKIDVGTNPQGDQGARAPLGQRKKRKKKNLGPTSPKKKKLLIIYIYIYIICRVVPHSSKNLESLPFNLPNPTSNYSTQKLNKIKILKLKNKKSQSVQYQSTSIKCSKL